MIVVTGASGALGRLVVEGLLDVAMADLERAWRDRLPDAFGRATTH